MSDSDPLLQHAAGYRARYSGDGLQSRPKLKLAIVACMDARLDPYGLFGLQPGDAHVIRNAGGLVSDADVRSLVLSQQLLGTEEIFLVHHSDCGMLGLDDEDFAKRLESSTGARPSWAAGGFSDLAASLRAQAASLRANPFLLHTDRIRGFVFDVQSGALDELAVS
jgi:carbonic anhydrase